MKHHGDLHICKLNLIARYIQRHEAKGMIFSKKGKTRWEKGKNSQNIKKIVKFLTSSETMLSCV